MLLVNSSAWKMRKFTPEVQQWIAGPGQLTALFLQTAWQVGEQTRGQPVPDGQMFGQVAALYNEAMMAVVMKNPPPSYMGFDKSMKDMEHGFAAQLHRALPALSCHDCALLTQLCHQQREQLQFMNLQNRLSEEPRAAWSAGKR